MLFLLTSFSALVLHLHPPTHKHTHSPPHRQCIAQPLEQRLKHVGQNLTADKTVTRRDDGRSLVCRMQLQTKKLILLPASTHHDTSYRQTHTKNNTKINHHLAHAAASAVAAGLILLMRYWGGYFYAEFGCFFLCEVFCSFSS